MSQPLHCPVCRAVNDQGPQCRRCKADLSLLLALEEQRQRNLVAALHDAAQGNWDRALAIAHGVEALRSDAEVCRLLAAGYLVRRDFPRAWEWLRAARTED